MAKKKAPKASSKKVKRRTPKLGAGQQRQAKASYKQLKKLAKKGGTDLDA